jgi:hypothetical protein
MLTDGAGNLFFGNPGSSQWLNGTSGTIFYSSGNIGINTTTPLALLSIVGSATSTAPLFDIASSSGTSLFRVSPNGTVTIGNNVPDPHTFSCPGLYANLGACLDAAKAYVTAAEDGTGRAVRIVLADGTYTLAAPYTLASGMQISGIMPRTIANGTDADLSMIPNGGTWINCGGVANTCFVGHDLRAVAPEKIGFENYGKVATFGGDGVAGVAFSTFQDIIAIGAALPSQTEAGLELYNFQHIHTSNLAFYRVNTGLHLISQISNQGPGNSVFDDTYIYTYAKSVANANNTKPGIWVEVKPESSSGIASPLNYLEFNRPQVNSYSGDGTGVGIALTGYDANHGVFGGGWYDVDVEGSLLEGVSLDYATGNSIHIAGSSSITNTINLGPHAVSNAIYSAHSGTTIAPLQNNSNIFYGVYYAQPSTGTWMRGDYTIFSTSLTNSSVDSLNLLSANGSVYFGGNAASNVKLRATGGTKVVARLGDDSADAVMAASGFEASAYVKVGTASITTDDTTNTYLKNTGTNGVLYLYSANVLHAALPPEGGIKIYNASSTPCDTFHEGTLFYVTGTPSALKMCMKQTAGTYALQTIFTAP